MAFLLLFVVPFLIAACPVIAILFLMRMKIIPESFALTLTATLLTTALGLGTTFLSIVFLCQCDGGWRAYMCYRCRDVPANRVTLDSNNFFDWLGINN